MNSGLPDREHHLNRRLNDVLPPHTRTTGEQDDDLLVRTAQRLAQGPDVTLSAAAFDRIEARLMAHLDAEPSRPVVEVPAVSPVRPHRHLRRMVFRLAAAFLVIMVGMVSLNQASAASLPGDRLYPVKRALEGLRVALATSDDEVDLRLSLAATRVDEFEALFARERIYPKALDEANRELNRALNLLANGHGDQIAADSQLRTISARTAALLERATPQAETVDHDRLVAIAADTTQVQQRIETLALTPGSPASHPTASPSPSHTPSITSTATVTRTPTASSTATTTHTPTASPTATVTHTPTSSPTTIPSHTPTIPTATPTATATRPPSVPPPSATPTRPGPGGPHQTPGSGGNNNGQGGPPGDAGGPSGSDTGQSNDPSGGTGGSSDSGAGQGGDAGGSSDSGAGQGSDAGGSSDSGAGQGSDAGGSSGSGSGQGSGGQGRP